MVTLLVVFLPGTCPKCIQGQNAGDCQQSPYTTATPPASSRNIGSAVQAMRLSGASSLSHLQPPPNGCIGQDQADNRRFCNVELFGSGT